MDDGGETLAVRVARVEERMNTKHAQYETGLQRQEARMAERDAKMAERDAKVDAKLEEFATKMAERDAKIAEHIAKMAERDTANTRWIVGTIAVAALLIVAVLGLLMRWPGPIP